jgi:hypothetical protein
MGWYQKGSVLYCCIICLTLFHETQTRNLILFSDASSIVMIFKKKTQVKMGWFQK